MPYSWIPIFEELADKLLSYENKQKDLVLLLKEAGVQGGLNDKSDNDKLLEVIDPFTFFAQIAKHADEKRSEIFVILKTKLKLAAEIPQDYMGVPRFDPRRAWLFHGKHKRKDDDIPILWALFKDRCGVAHVSVCQQ
jgi:hypothetical protein